MGSESKIVMFVTSSYVIEIKFVFYAPATSAIICEMKLTGFVFMGLFGGMSVGGK